MHAGFVSVIGTHISIIILTNEPSAAETGVTAFCKLIYYSYRDDQCVLPQHASLYAHASVLGIIDDIIQMSLVGFSLPESPRLSIRKQSTHTHVRFVGDMC